MTTEQRRDSLTAEEVDEEIDKTLKALEKTVNHLRESFGDNNELMSRLHELHELNDKFVVNFQNEYKYLRNSFIEMKTLLTLSNQLFGFSVFDDSLGPVLNMDSNGNDDIEVEEREDNQNEEQEDDGLKDEEDNGIEEQEDNGVEEGEDTEVNEGVITQSANNSLATSSVPKKPGKARKRSLTLRRKSISFENRFYYCYTDGCGGRQYFGLKAMQNHIHSMHLNKRPKDKTSRFNRFQPKINLIRCNNSSAKKSKTSQQSKSSSKANTGSKATPPSKTTSTPKPSLPSKALPPLPPLRSLPPSMTDTPMEAMPPLPPLPPLKVRTRSTANTPLKISPSKTKPPKTSQSVPKPSPVPTIPRMVYSCKSDGCDQKYYSLEEMQKHIRSKHLQKKNKWFNCPFM